ncbi:MAG TPA: GatB/YqeY domain-containing protein [Spirillospora sp.]
MTLKEKLETDLSAAIKARDEVRARTLRMALTAVKNEEVAGKRSRELSDDDVLKVLAKEAKKRREAADAYVKAGREDQARAERDEGAVLAEYLPAQLSDEELSALVADAIAETGASGPRAMGQVMKVVTPKVAGRAEGARVAAEVRRQLGQ